MNGQVAVSTWPPWNSRNLFANELLALSLIPICRGSMLWQLIFTAIFWSGLAQLVALEFTSGGIRSGRKLLLTEKE